MCGLAGFWQPSAKQSAAQMQELIHQMTNTLIHRGPDADGIWVAADQGIALGHRRLSIIDLSQQASQPMATPCGQFQLVYNGELYNYRELRERLNQSGYTFRSDSDTEVLLAAILNWGMQETLQQANGMYAFAWWDRQNQQLTLARDRLGIKPLYYGWSEDTFLFASEPKALRQHSAFNNQLDRNALAAYFCYGYVPAPLSIHQHIRKLLPGSFITINPQQATQPESVQPKQYWSLYDVVTHGQRNKYIGTIDEATDEFEQLLSESIARRMVADVPLGAFLSGGIDSSLIVALMQNQSAQPVQTYTIGFEEQSYNEAEYAKAIAQHLGTKHTEMYVNSQQARDVIPLLPSMYDEPFGDSSQIPTFLVSQLAREHVTVSLSGDGGDELFCGYNRYPHLHGIWNKINRMPFLLRSASAALLSAVRKMSGLSRGAALQSVLGMRDAAQLYAFLNTHWRDTSEIVIEGQLPQTFLNDFDQRPQFSHPCEAMMVVDTHSYLPDDILVKVDRASMAVGLEARVPLLDHHVVEFAWRLPLEMKYTDVQSKILLRKVLHRHVPPEFYQRPKTGFGVPIDSWLRGPLRDWAEDLLSERKLIEQGYLYPEPIQEKWREHLQGTTDWHYLLWDVLMFQAWLESS